jgi:hypothetical protein
MRVNTPLPDIDIGRCSGVTIKQCGGTADAEAACGQ